VYSGRDLLQAAIQKLEYRKDRINPKELRYRLPSKMSKEARRIYNIFNIKRSMTPYIMIISQKLTI